MELFLFLLVAAAGGFLYINHQMKKKSQEAMAKTDETPAPYKVEPTQEVKVESSPVAETKAVESVNVIAEQVKCGCGRSPTGFCVGLHKLTAEEWANHSDNPNKVKQIVEVVKTRKPRTTKPKTEVKTEVKTRGRKPAAKKSVAKKSRSKKA